MKIEKVTYQKTYSIGPYLTDRVGFEASLDEPRREQDGSYTIFTPEGALSELEKIADEWHKKSHPHLYQEEKQFVPLAMGGTIDKPNWQAQSVPAAIDYKKIEQMEADIDNCQSLEELEQWKTDNPTFPARLLGTINEKRKKLMDGKQDQ